LADAQPMAKLETAHVAQGNDLRRMVAQQDRQ